MLFYSLVIVVMIHKTLDRIKCCSDAPSAILLLPEEKSSFISTCVQVKIQVVFDPSESSA